MKRCIGIFAAMAMAGTWSASAAFNYAIVDTGQAKCYNNRDEIAPPQPGQPFYGQDAQFPRHPASYTLSADGLTVHDNITGLTWQRSPDTDGDGAVTTRDKLTFPQAEALPAKLNAAKFGGFSDWRLPTIKELYSLFQANGIDPSGPPGHSAPGQKPFIDTKFFKFAYGSTQDGERVIDSQWATSTTYHGWSGGGIGKMFGVNFADGRIKGYDRKMPNRGEKTFFVLCVRGNPAYGKNDFHDNGDGTVTDRATGLQWTKTDSGRGMNWQQALAWAQQKNAAKYLGHDDWRVPNVKELQSIVDYSRAPDTTHSAAIDPVLSCTAITNEIDEADFGFYWSSTTHVGSHGANDAMYVAFGRASGWMPGRPRPIGGPQAGRGNGSDRLEPDFAGPPERRGGFNGDEGPGGPPPNEGGQGMDDEDYHYLDVHGAGAQRGDPKFGDPSMFPHGRGPQGDVVRIYNFVRLVRSMNGQRY
jgi:hypothetical protein